MIPCFMIKEIIIDYSCLLFVKFELLFNDSIFQFLLTEKIFK